MLASKKSLTSIMNFNTDDRRMTFLGGVMYSWSEKDPSLENVISSVLYFNEPLDISRVRTIVKERMLPFERLHSIASHDSSGKLIWKGVPNVDLSYHVVLHEDILLSNRRAVDEFISETYKMPLPSSRPLWRFHIVPMESNKCALIARFHHSIADGTTLVQLLFSLMDKSTTGHPKVALKRSTVSLQESFGSPSLLVSKLQLMLSGFIKGATFPLHFKDTPNALKIPSISHLSTVKRVCCADGESGIPTSDFKNVANKVGGTINDVIVATLSLTIRQYLLRQKDPCLKSNPRFRVMFPYNMRQGAVDIRNPKHFGNQFTILPLHLVITESDPLSVLLASKARCDEIKSSPMAIVIMSMNKSAMALLPSWMYSWITFQLLEKASALFTNVPGPLEKVSFANSLVEDLMFYVPSLSAVTFSIISYAGIVNIGVMTDGGPQLKHKVDPSVITKLFHSEFLRLKNVIDNKTFEECQDAEHAFNNQSKVFSSGVVALMVLSIGLLFTNLL